MVKVIFFDLDGTLLDSETYWRQSALRMLCEKNIVMPPDILARQDELYCTAMFKEVLSRPHIAERINMTIEECLKWTFENMAMLYRCAIEMKPHALELLRYVKSQGYKTVLVTATKPVDADAVFTRFGLHEYFDLVHSTYGQTENKSKPELFERLAAQFGAKTEECILIDDARYALEGAKNAGCQAWAIEEPVHKLKEERIKQASTRYFKSHEEIIEALKELA